MSRRNLQSVAAAAGLALLLAAVRASAGEISGRATPIDGDSLTVGDREIRLRGIDAPEWDQACTREGHVWRCGEAAAAALRALVDGRRVRCTWRERDDYGRALATCFRDGEDLNAAMVERGMALAYRHYSDAYAAQEDRARAHRAGLWAAEFTPPWQWRHAHHDRHSGACAVKGNVNREGERIYHVRGGRDYDRVRIHPDEGDRCFDSAAEAEGAGFRRPRGTR